MKKLLITLASLCCGFAVAQDTPTTVPSALAAPALTYLSDARPSADARFYIYLSSASWCPPCRALMPKVVAEYPAIKAAGGEVILLCFDRTLEAGRKYLQNYKAGFPGIMCSFEDADKLPLPGFAVPRGIPNVIFVTPDGKVLSNGHGFTLLDWSKVTAQLP